MPATGIAGQPVSFSQAAYDVWSGPAEINWSFGDGESAEGEAVQHTYAQPGTYQGNVTVGDQLGFSLIGGYTIVISPAPPPAGGGEQPTPVPTPASPRAASLPTAGPAAHPTRALLTFAWSVGRALR